MAVVDHAGQRGLGWNSTAIKTRLSSGSGTRPCAKFMCQSVSRPTSQAQKRLWNGKRAKGLEPSTYGLGMSQIEARPRF